MISQEIQLILSGQNLASPQIDAIVASLDAMSAGVTRADAVVTQLGSTLGMATTTLQGFGAALDLAVAGVVRLEDSLGRHQDALVNGFRSISVAAGDSLTVLDAYIARLADVDAAQLAASISVRVLAVSMGMGGVTGSAAPAIAADVMPAPSGVQGACWPQARPTIWGLVAGRSVRPLARKDWPLGPRSMAATRHASRGSVPERQRPDRRPGRS